MSHNYKAASEANAINKRKWNQHSVTYYFDDKSQITIYTTSGYSVASSKLWKGNSNDTHLRPLSGLPICVNK